MDANLKDSILPNYCDFHKFTSVPKKYWICKVLQQIFLVLLIFTIGKVPYTYLPTLERENNGDFINDIF